MSHKELTVERLLYRIPQAAEALGIGRTVVYSEMAAGRLGFVRRGRARLVPAEALAAYVELLKAETSGA